MWNSAGTYLEHQVLTIGAADLESAASAFGPLECAVVVVVNLGRPATLQGLFQRIVQLNPLSLVIVGSDQDFDHLLAAAGEYQRLSPHHVQTYHWELDSQWLESVFYASWPASELADAWKEIRILVVGDDQVTRQRVLGAIDRFLDQGRENA